MPEEPLAVRMVTDELIPKGGYSIAVAMGGKERRLFLDCGSVVNLMARRAVRQEEIIQPKDMYVLKAFSKDELTPLGYVRKVVTFSNECVALAMTLIFWVVDDEYFDGSDDGILGIGWFTNFEVRTMFDLMAIKVKGFEFEVHNSNSEPGMWKIMREGVEVESVRAQAAVEAALAETEGQPMEPREALGTMPVSKVGVECASEPGSEPGTEAGPNLATVLGLEVCAKSKTLSSRVEPAAACCSWEEQPAVVGSELSSHTQVEYSVEGAARGERRGGGCAGWASDRAERGSGSVCVSAGDWLSKHPDPDGQATGWWPEIGNSRESVPEWLPNCQASDRRDGYTPSPPESLGGPSRPPAKPPERGRMAPSTQKSS